MTDLEVASPLLNARSRDAGVGVYITVDSSLVPYEEAHVQYCAVSDNQVCKISDKGTGPNYLAVVYCTDTAVRRPVYDISPICGDAAVIQHWHLADLATSAMYACASSHAAARVRRPRASRLVAAASAQIPQCPTDMRGSPTKPVQFQAWKSNSDRTLVGARGAARRAASKV